jgi:4-hydroxyphenylpyruvate dioxygenase
LSIAVRWRLQADLTHNVYRGRMDYWAGYTSTAAAWIDHLLGGTRSLFNFREIRFFDIKGEYTGLKSRAMTAPDGKIRIPLNEEGKAAAARSRSTCCSTTARASSTSPLPATTSIGCWDKLKANGVPFMTAPPDTYYEMLEERLPGHGEPVDELKARGLLLDGSTDGQPRLLLQIFSETLIGPVFFEFIQRKEDEGFGEGNFQALFESMERDQIQRGALKVDEDA